MDAKALFGTFGLIFIGAGAGGLASCIMTKGCELRPFQETFIPLLVLAFIAVVLLLVANFLEKKLVVKS